MENFLTKLDIFGRTINFRFKTQNSFKTAMGGVFTLCSLFFIIFFSFIIGRDFYFGTNPNIYYETIVPSDYPDPLSLNPYNFLIAWRIEYYDKHAMDLNQKKILHPITRRFQLRRNESGNLNTIENKLIPTVKCNDENAKVSEFSEYDKDEWFCFDWSSGNYTFGGFFDGEYVDAYQTQLYMCSGGAAYSKSNPNCTTIQDYEDFEKLNNKIQVSIMYPQYHFVPEDLTNPLKIYYKNYYYYLSYKTFQIDRLFFQLVDIDDDQGLIFESINSDSKISFFSKQSESSFNEIVQGGSSQIYEFNLYMERSSLKIKRSFMKVQDLYAKLGGIIKLVLFVFSVFNAFLTYYVFQIGVLKEILTLEEEQGKEFCSDNLLGSRIYEKKAKKDPNNINNNNKDFNIASQYFQKIQQQRKEKMQSSFLINNLPNSQIKIGAQSKSEIGLQRVNINNYISHDQRHSPPNDSSRVLLKEERNKEEKTMVEREEGIRNSNFINSTNKNVIDSSNSNLKLKTRANEMELVHKNNKNTKEEKDKEEAFSLSRSHIKVNSDLNPIKIGIYDGFKWKYCSKICRIEPKKIKAFGALDKIFTTKLDLFFYLKSLINLHFMKEIIFSKKQGKMLEFLHKPSIFEEKEIKRFGFGEFIEKDPLKESEKVIIEYFRERVENDKLDRIDEKFIYLLNKELKSKIAE